MHRLPIPALNSPRQTGMGVSNVLTRVGSMMAPLVRITGELHPFVPNLIFGATALLGGGASLFLPETLHQPLPETIEDVEKRSVPALASRVPPRVPLGEAGLAQGFPRALSPRSPPAKEPKPEPEAEKDSQRIPLQPCGPDLGPS